MRWLSLASAVALVFTTLGCERHGENAPTVSQYEQQREAMLRRQQAAQSGAAQRAAGVRHANADTPQSGGIGPADGEFGTTPAWRDPFRSFVLDRSAELAEEERGPLEQFDLAQLTVVAVVWGTKRARALIEDPSGRGYVIQEGTPIGKNDGYVTQITDNSVTVLETYVDYLGESTQKSIEMRVRQTQGG